MTRWSSLLVLAVLVGVGCGDTFCESRGLTVAIWNPPAEVADYAFEIEFDGRTVEFGCAPELDKPGLCETTAGPWLVSAVVFPAPPPDDDTGAAPVTLSIYRRDDFSSYVPQAGEVRVALTSLTTPGFQAEHVFVPAIEGSSDCQSATEDWDLAE